MFSFLLLVSLGTSESATLKICKPSIYGFATGARCAISKAGMACSLSRLVASGLKGPGRVPAMSQAVEFGFLYSSNGGGWGMFCSWGI